MDTTELVLNVLAANWRAKMGLWVEQNIPWGLTRPLLTVGLGRLWGFAVYEMGQGNFGTGEKILCVPDFFCTFPAEIAV